MENSVVNFLKEKIQLQVRITQSDYNNDVDVSTGVSLNVLKSLLKECEQANELFKQQIIDAWNSAYGGDSNYTGDEYYNTTFKSE